MGSKLIPENYGPVSILPNFEKIAYGQLFSLYKYLLYLRVITFAGMGIILLSQFLFLHFHGSWAVWMDHRTQLDCCPYFFDCVVCSA